MASPRSSLLSTATTRTRSNYNRLACCYDSWSSWEAPYIDEGFSQLEIKPGDHVLDVGCATGAFLERAYHAAGSSGSCVGIDLSPAMCRAAQSRINQLRRRESKAEATNESFGSCEVICGDAVKILTERDKQYDRVSMTFVLELFDGEFNELFPDCVFVVCCFLFLLVLYHPNISRLFTHKS